MATAPRAPIGQVESIPGRPVYGDPNAARGAFSSGAAEAGAQLAGDLSSGLDAIVEAQARIQQRNDAVQRATLSRPLPQFGLETLTALQATDDIANPLTVGKYREMLDAKRQEILDSHTGSPNSRAILETTLIEQQTELMNSAAVASTTASRKAVGDQLGIDLSNLSAAGAANPSDMPNLLDRWNQTVDNMKDALQPDEELAWRKRGPAVLAEAVIDNMLMQPNGDIEVTRLMKTSPGLFALMEPEQQTMVRDRINTVARANAEARNKTYKVGRDEVLYDSQGNVIARGPVTPPPQTEGQKLQEAFGILQGFGFQPSPRQAANMVSQAYGMGKIDQPLKEQVDEKISIFTERNNGTPPSPDQVARLLEMNVDTPKTVTQKLSEIQAIRAANKQPPLTEDQLNMVQGIYISPNLSYADKVEQMEAIVGPMSREELLTLGNARPPREQQGPIWDDDATQVFEEIGARFAEGNTTPQEDRRIELAVNAFVQPRYVLDPTNGTYVQTPGKILPQFVQEALKARGWQVPQPTADVGAGGQPVEQPTPPAGGQPPPPTTGQQPAGAPAPAGTQAPAAQPQQGAAPARVGPTAEAAAAQGAQPQAGAQRPQAQSSVAGEPAPTQQEPTLFEMAPLVTGPVSKGKALVTEAPVPGLAGVGDLELGAQTALGLRTQALISVLQNAKFYSEKEYTRLEKMLDLSGKVFDNVQSYRTRLVELDNELEQRGQDAARIIANPQRSSSAERKDAMAVLNAIENFRQNLIPPKVNTPEEEALFLRSNPGAIYITPSGPDGSWQLRKTPAGAQ